MLKITTTGKFDKKLEDLSVKNKATEQAVKRKMILFRRNPQDTHLRNHPLTKRMKGKWAFSIDKDVRIVYQGIGPRTVKFFSLGTHEEVYRK